MNANQFTHPWTQKEIKFIQKNIGKMTYEKIGSLISRSYSSIQSKVRYLSFQKKIKKHFVNSDFFKKWSREMSYVLGFVAADGNICHSGRAHSLHIACDDVDVIQKIKTVMEYSGPVHKKFRLNGKISYSLRICDQIIFHDLNALGITERKSLTLSPSVNGKFMADFLRGFLDGDGTVYVRNTKYPSRLAVIFYTASLPMAKFLSTNLKKLLGKLSKSSIQYRFTKQNMPYYAVSFGHKASLKIYSIFYTNTRLYMERKFQKFLQGMQTI